MRSRAGPFRALALLGALAVVALMNTGCVSTRAKIGHAIGEVGGLVVDTGKILLAVADVVVNGPAEDARSATDAIGITAPSNEAPKPVTLPAPAPSSSSARPGDDETLPFDPWTEPVTGVRPDDLPSDLYSTIDHRASTRALTPLRRRT